ncbi:MAG: DUF4342 domain-containing protein [Bacteroidetes bacterium]|nr:DUF4342 domain-containing protein [Bacteroidota bacterium]
MNRIQELIREGNVRRLIIRTSGGRQLADIPLTAGVVVGGAGVIFYPMLMALVAIAALFARVQVEVVRVKKEGEQ